MLPRGQNSNTRHNLLGVYDSSSTPGLSSSQWLTVTAPMKDTIFGWFPEREYARGKGESYCRGGEAQSKTR